MWTGTARKPRTRHLAAPCSGDTVDWATRNGPPKQNGRGVWPVCEICQVGKPPILELVSGPARSLSAAFGSPPTAVFRRQRHCRTALHASMRAYSSPRPLFDMKSRADSAALAAPRAQKERGGKTDRRAPPRGPASPPRIHDTGQPPPAFALSGSQDPPGLKRGGSRKTPKRLPCPSTEAGFGQPVVSQPGILPGVLVHFYQSNRRVLAGPATKLATSTLSAQHSSAKSLASHAALVRQNHTHRV